MSFSDFFLRGTLTEGVKADLPFTFPAALRNTTSLARAGFGSYYDVSGVLRNALWNTPRFTYDPVSHAAQGLMVEPQGTNLITYSEMFDNASWSKIASSVTANQAVAPDGNTTADLLKEDTSNGQHYAQSNLVAKPATASVYTFSVFVKRSATGSARDTLVSVSDNSGNGAWIACNLGTGAYITSVAYGTFVLLSYGITNVGSGWYRISVTALSSTVAQVYGQAEIYNATYTYTGDGASGIYIWGAQLEAGLTASSYIPTNSTNLATYSESFDNAAWVKNGTCTVTGNTTTAPDGNQTADTINTPASSDRINLAAISITGGNTYTFSCWLSGSGTTCLALTTTGGTTQTNANTITLTSTLTRYSVTLVTIGGNTAVTPSIGRWNGTAGAGTATSCVAWGSQLENNTLPSLYISTGGNSVSYVSTSATNLAMYSEQIDNTIGWTGTNTTITQNATTAPDGATTAEKVAASVATGYHHVFQSNFTITNGGTYTASAYVKAGGETTGTIAIFDGTFTNGASAKFDISSTGTISSSTAIGSGTLSYSSITALANGWFRVSVSGIASTATVGSMRIFLRDNTSYTGDGTSGLYIWGAQYQSSAYQEPMPSSYVATTSAPSGANQINPSQDFTTGGGPNWPSVNLTITKNVATAPDSSGTGNKIVENTTASVQHSLGNGTSGGGFFTASIYAKPYSGSRQLYLKVDDGTNSVYAVFDVSAGTVTVNPTASGTSASYRTAASISAAANGWYRCSIGGYVSGNANMDIYLYNSGITYTGDGSSGLYIWGAQLEPISYSTVYGPDVYIQTTSVTVSASAAITTAPTMTRAADAIAISNVTSTRSGNASYYNSLGTLSYAPWNTPRYTYNPATGVAQGLMVEPQGTNLLTYSVPNTNWPLGFSTLTINSLAAPDGTLTGTLLTEASGSYHSASSVLTAITSGVAYTATVYAKAGTGRYLQVATIRLASNYVSVIFDLQNGVVGETSVGATSGTITASSITPVGNGWYRCSVSFSLVQTSTYLVLSTAGALSGNSYASDGTLLVASSSRTYYLWGAQLETGSLATSYIPTNSTNLLTYSEQFDNAAWTKGGSSVTANNTPAPDGNATADKLVEDTSSATHYTTGSASVTTGLSYTVSCYIKANTRQSAVIGFLATNSAFALTQVLVNLTNGVTSVLSGTPTAYGAVAVGNGWYRVYVTQTSTATATGVVGLYTYNNALSYTGDGTSSIYLWGAQLEQNTVPSTYLATTSSAITTAPTMTRAADTSNASVPNGKYDVLVQDKNGAAWSLAQTISGGALSITPRSGQTTVSRVRTFMAGALSAADRNALQIAG